ncbi:MAG: putative tRNA threonylcarbamoyladenosine biosynthesis protein Gcp [Microgenomates bacterium 39_7]|nr:MAG: putative tRNA threonylcarbamoyladenosine biosynthesis protein Gcp [Microgenomates bacterium 39_7]
MKNKDQNSSPLILAIDTSCDETSAAVTQGRVVLANIIASQAQIHQPYGGVFPTLAKQAHLEMIAPTVKKALTQARVDIESIDAIAVTQGPGLAPALEVGIEYAENLARKHSKPIYGINHLEAHLLAVLALRNKRGNKNISKETYTFKKGTALDKESFPILGIIVSGGHSQFVQIDRIGQYVTLGETVDDALGEALDKVGRMLDLGYPAGPIMEKFAKKGDSNRYDFPLPMTAVKDFNLSYSGLKTAASREIKKAITQKETKGFSRQDIFDFSASFQKAAFRHLTYKLDKLLNDYNTSSFKEVWLGGGVASNITLRNEIRKVLRQHHLQLITPYEKKLCADNAAMIGVTAGLRVMHIQTEPTINLDRKPSWNL